jgi:hypothetical protein
MPLDRPLGAPHNSHGAVPLHLELQQITIFRSNGVPPRKSALLRRAALTFLPMGLLLGAAWAQTETVLYTFTGTPDGHWPYAGVVLGAKGDI